MAKSNLGKVFRGRTKYIDPEIKRERNYVVVRDNGKFVSVAKIRSAKKLDDRGKDVNKKLYVLDQKKYPLSKPSGVDYQRYSKNRMSNKNLALSDRNVFPEEKERFSLSSHDTYCVVRHTFPKKKNPR